MVQMIIVIVVMITVNTTIIIMIIISIITMILIMIIASDAAPVRRVNCYARSTYSILGLTILLIILTQIFLV